MRINNSTVAGYGCKKMERGYTKEQRQFIETPTKRMTLFVREGMVASHAMNSGVSYWLRYDEASTEETPCMIAEGIDEDGNEFCKKIFVKDVNPKNATYIEMAALETHLNGGKFVSQKGMALTASSNMGLNDRYNFVDNYQEYVHLLAQSHWHGYEEYNRYMAEFERNLFEQFHKVI